MDAKCSQLLPSVCTILADPGHPVADDTCLEKLLDWFKALASAGPSVLVLKENPCLIELILAVLKQGEPDPILLSFILRLTGIFAASESSFQYLQQQEVVFGAFGEAGPLGSPLWEDMTIRSGWVQGAYTMLRHYSAFQFLCNSGALDMIFTLQEDPSLFIAAAANRLLARLLIFSVESEPSRLLSSKDCDWPACARMMVARVEEALTSRSSSRIKHSLKLLMTLFEHSQDAWTEILWSRLAETVEALLMEDSVHVGPWFVDLFLSMARSPAFSSHECSLWKLVALALKNISLAHVGPLAHGLLKLEACPQALQAQSLAVLLQPMDGILRATSPHAASPSEWYNTVLLTPVSIRPEFPHDSEFPHQPLICSVVTILQFCAGQAVSSSSFGATLGHLLIGSFRVQRAALSLLGALSRWAGKPQHAGVSYTLPFLFLQITQGCGHTRCNNIYYSASFQIFKKALQGTLKWLRSALRPSVSLADVQQHTLRVLRKHLCSPSWEVRDSSLEFLSLAMKHLRGLDWFWQELLSSEVPRLLEDLLGDPESYVRASAVRTWGLWRKKTPTNLQQPLLCVGGVRLLEILSSDAEGFPRRAAIGVFLDWLKEGHPEASASPAEFVSRALQAVDGDLDWEVKMAALDLVGVFIGQTFGQLEQSSTSAGSSLANLADVLRLFGQMKMLGFLFRALQDCDRPVAVKACEVLLALKSSVCKHRSKSSPSGDASGLKKVPTESSSSPLSSLPAGEAAEKDCQDPERLRQILEFTNLEGLRRALDVSSDHLERSPQSLLQDLLAAAGDAEENRVDCY
uniref:BRCA1 associated ATM activator 1 n=1 Tax=Pseudonaja textilis TaxID=8673 RepID=A0A670ZQ73_PSETE